MCVDYLGNSGFKIKNRREESILTSWSTGFRVDALGWSLGTSGLGDLMH